MKAHTDQSADEFVISFSDFRLICRKGKYKIFFGTILFALLAAFYTLTRPIEYRAEATFKEKGKSQSGLNRSLSALFFSGLSEGESEAMSLMKSRKLMEQLVKKLGLQSVIAEKKPLSLLPIKTIKENLSVEYALFKKKVGPALPDRENILESIDVVFNREVPLTLEIAFISEGEFNIYGMDKSLIGKASLGKHFAADGYQFTLVKKTDTPLTSQRYFLTLIPLTICADSLSKQFTVELDRLDKNLLKIGYKHRDRHLAARHLNEMMEVYQTHLQKEHQRLAGIQLSYLEKRQDEMREHLSDLMKEQAQMLSKDARSTGFADTDRAIEFLATSQASYKQKLMSIEMEMQRLQNMQKQGELSYDKFAFREDAGPIMIFASEIRSLKQQADSLDLALRNAAPVDPKSLQEAFMIQMSQLEEIKECSKEAKMVVASLDKGDFFYRPSKLMNSSKFMVKTWYDKLRESRESSKNEEFRLCKASFSAYLANLIHLFDVHQKSIEERLAHQQSPQVELQGIDLKIANELYLSYSKELNEVQTKIIQDKFVLQQIDDPEFEISSLSTVLNDAISSQMISKSGTLILAIKDKDNRTPHEVERLKGELAIQKGFLRTHLQQTIQLLNLHMEHLKGKIQQTQSALLTLTQEKITILQKHMGEYIVDTLGSLEIERNLINAGIDEIRQDMSRLPEQRINETLVDQQMEINQKMIEELIKLVESKNINNNLELIQSAPVDLAIAPFHPKPPRLMLFTLLGAFVGSFLSLSWIVVRSITSGIQATADNLVLSGMHVSGALTRTYSIGEPMLDEDLSTLRRLSTFFEQPSRPRGQTLLLLKGRGLDFSSNFAELLVKKGLKALVLPLSFTSQADAKELPGLYQYLEGNAAEPKIIKSAGFDYISAGGICRFSNELICSRRFQDLLERLQSRYDWIIAVAHVQPESAEAASLLESFPYAVINVVEEALDQLKACMQHARSHKTSFIISS